MKSRINIFVIFVTVSCLITISSADIGIGISDVGTISSVTGIEEKNTTTGRYSLLQNYPNPFNPSTTIEFSIPKTDFVTLKIYNVLGQEVSALVSDKLTPGNYTYTLDASGFASGIYLYKIETGSFSQTKKMVLLQ